MTDMESNRNIKQILQQYIPCYFSFFVNGMMVLMIGTILPYLIMEANINFSIAGGFLSAFAIGNLLASFINPPLIARFGRKIVIITTSFLIPGCLMVIMAIPAVPLLYLTFVLLGVGRGSVSIFNNTVVNELSGGKSSMLNLMHMAFAFGAFMAPFLATLYLQRGLTWRHLGYTVVGLFVLVILLFIRMPKINDGRVIGSKDKSRDKLEDNSKDKSSGSFIRSVDFYVIGLILFFYLGLENCVNGWFVTYFKEAGVMSDSHATNLVSYTWMAVMIGRLVTAVLSSRIAKRKIILFNSICTACFFVLLIATTNVVIISAAIILLGFFFAGIYPTCIANAGSIIKGSASGMSMLLAIAAFGGIIAPQIVGFVADAIGLSGAIMVLTVSVFFMVVFALVNYSRKTVT